MKLELNYTGGALHFMEELCRQGKEDTAWAIKSKVKEVCVQGAAHRDLMPTGETKNLYQLHTPAGDSDGAGHPGFRAVLIVMKDRVLVTQVDVVVS